MQTIDVRMPYMLSERHLWAAVAFAFLLHTSGLVVWSYSPKQIVRDIPIRTLNVRLEDAGEEQLEQQISFANAPSVDVALDKIADSIAPKPTIQQQAISRAVSAIAKPPALSNETKQYVREVSTPNTTTSLKLGEKGAKDAEVMSRYTQLISLWVQKFKVYPEEARVGGFEGATVVRVRIDRKGNVRYYALERSTGIEMLDRAAIEMIKRANPVPAVPADYPKGDLLEFLIPVNFSLL